MGLSESSPTHDEVQVEDTPQAMVCPVPPPSFTPSQPPFTPAACPAACLPSRSPLLFPPGVSVLPSFWMMRMCPHFQAYTRFFCMPIVSHAICLSGSGTVAAAVIPPISSCAAASSACTLTGKVLCAPICACRVDVPSCPTSVNGILCWQECVSP